MMRPLLFAAVGLSALPAAAGEFPPEVWFTPCDRPAATCVSPRASHRAGDSFFGDVEAAERPRCGGRPAGVLGDDLAYADVPLTPIADPAREWLARWQAASRDNLPVGEAERTRLRFASPARSGQELDLACEFLGPVDGEDLARRYEWTTIAQAGGHVRLTATPKDELERLFYDRFTVTLDAAGQPVEVQFGNVITVGGIDDRAIALHPWSGALDDRVWLVGFESRTTELPIRTADLSGDSPRLLRDDAAALALPPAPAPCDFVAPPEPVEAPKPDSRHDGEPAALREVLEKFDRNYARADRRRLELRRWKYDGVFAAETQEQVEVYLEGHGRGWIETSPADTDGLKSSRPGFALKPAKADGWRWEADRITTYDPAGSTFSSVPRPSEADENANLWGPLNAFSSPEGMLPVWSARSADDLRSNFRLMLAESKGDIVVVTATPAAHAEAYHYQRIDILFDRATGRPRATRVVDPTGSSEVVFAAQAIELDGPRPPVKALRPSVRPATAVARVTPPCPAASPSLTLWPWRLLLLALDL